MSDERMPVLFIGHGSPINALEDNEYSRTWEALGKEPAPPESDRLHILPLGDGWYPGDCHGAAAHYP